MLLVFLVFTVSTICTVASPQWKHVQPRILGKSIGNFVEFDGKIVALQGAQTGLITQKGLVWANVTDLTKWDTRFGSTNHFPGQWSSLYVGHNHTLVSQAPFTSQYTHDGVHWTALAHLPFFNDLTTLAAGPPGNILCASVKGKLGIQCYFSTGFPTNISSWTFCGKTDFHPLLFSEVYYPYVQWDPRERAFILHGTDKQAKHSKGTDKLPYRVIKLEVKSTNKTGSTCTLTQLMRFSNTSSNVISGTNWWTSTSWVKGQRLILTSKGLTSYNSMNKSWTTIFKADNDPLQLSCYSEIKTCVALYTDKLFISTSPHVVGSWKLVKAPQRPLDGAPSLSGIAYFHSLGKWFIGGHAGYIAIGPNLSSMRIVSKAPHSTPSALFTIGKTFYALAADNNELWNTTDGETWHVTRRLSFNPNIVTLTNGKKLLYACRKNKLVVSDNLFQTINTVYSWGKNITCDTVAIKPNGNAFVITRQGVKSGHMADIQYIWMAKNYMKPQWERLFTHNCSRWVFSDIKATKSIVAASIGGYWSFTARTNALHSWSAPLGVYGKAVCPVGYSIFDCESSQLVSDGTNLYQTMGNGNFLNSTANMNSTLLQITSSESTTMPVHVFPHDRNLQPTLLESSNRWLVYDGTTNYVQSTSGDFTKWEKLPKVPYVSGATFGVGQIASNSAGLVLVAIDDEIGEFGGYYSIDLS